MNENVMAIISQSVSTTVMNLLLFLFYRRIYEPKFQNKTVYIFTFIATTAFEQDLGKVECSYCGQCASVCPTGAILEDM